MNITGSPLGSTRRATFSFLSFNLTSKSPRSTGLGKNFSAKSKKLFNPTPFAAEVAKTGVRFLLIIEVLIPVSKSASERVPASKYLFISSSLSSATFSINSVLNCSAFAFNSSGISSSVSFFEPTSP